MHRTRATRLVLPFSVSFLLAAGCSSAALQRSINTPRIVLLERCANSTRPPQDCKFSPVHLDDVGEPRLRELIDAARYRQAREDREAERLGQITGGVWGFVSYSYRLTFAGSDQPTMWLHVSDRAAWLDAGERGGHVVFTAEESVELRRFLEEFSFSTPQ